MTRCNAEDSDAVFTLHSCLNTAVVRDESRNARHVEATSPVMASQLERRRRLASSNNDGGLLFATATSDWPPPFSPPESSAMATASHSRGSASRFAMTSCPDKVTCKTKYHLQHLPDEEEQVVPGDTFPILTNETVCKVYNENGNRSNIAKSIIFDLCVLVLSDDDQLPATNQQEKCISLFEKEQFSPPSWKTDICKQWLFEKEQFSPPSWKTDICKQWLSKAVTVNNKNNNNIHLKVLKCNLLRFHSDTVCISKNLNTANRGRMHGLVTKYIFILPVLVLSTLKLASRSLNECLDCEPQEKEMAPFVPASGPDPSCCEPILEALELSEQDWVPSLPNSLMTAFCFYDALCSHWKPEHQSSLNHVLCSHDENEDEIAPQGGDVSALNDVSQRVKRTGIVSDW
ncbi:hypothetical protein C0J52_23170 [Blattella germanica]|nr:hypothetical protein C0J52_23170 [Blattella germanica]